MSNQNAGDPAWPGFAMEHIMKTLNFVNASLVQAPSEEKEKLTHKLEDNLYCAKVLMTRCMKYQQSSPICSTSESTKSQMEHLAVSFASSREDGDIKLSMQLSTCEQTQTELSEKWKY